MVVRRPYPDEQPDRDHWAAAAPPAGKDGLVLLAADSSTTKV